MKSTIGKIIGVVALVVVVGLVAYGVQAADEKNIVDTAQEAGNFTTFCDAVEKAGLVETLQSAGPFTVFAPSDEAFAMLPPGTLDNLMSDQQKLKALLLHHVVPGNVMTSDLMMLKSLTTAAGDELKVDAMGDSVMIDDARITKSDIPCTNGVINVIDTVLLP